MASKREEYSETCVRCGRTIVGLEEIAKGDRIDVPEDDPYNDDFTCGDCLDELNETTPEEQAANAYARMTGDVAAVFGVIERRIDESRLDARARDETKRRQDERRIEGA
jgi:hypothetical protein